MSLLRTILYTIVFYIGSVPYVVGSVLCIPFKSTQLGRRGAILVPRGWAQFHYLCVRWILGIRVQVVGVLPQTRAIVAIKHESMLETTETLRLFTLPAVVFKAELLRIPLWGTAALSHGVIPVEREAGASALRTMLKAARRSVAEGRAILIFPEGTRVPHGERAPLRPGIAGLYKSLGLPIVPIACDSGKLWPRGRFVKEAGVVTLLVGDPIEPGLPREAVEARVFAGINALNS